MALLVSDLLGSALGCERLELLQGIGTMGYPMTLNLRKKIPNSAILVIAELNQDAVKRFLEETKELGDVIVPQSPREVAEKSVSRT